MDCIAWKYLEVVGLCRMLLLVAEALSEAFKLADDAEERGKSIQLLKCKPMGSIVGLSDVPLHT
jgi:hypothetical protein